LSNISSYLVFFFNREYCEHILKSASINKKNTDWLVILKNVELVIKQLGLDLPEAPKPVAAYIPAKQSGKLVFTSGQLPMVKGELISKGLLGQDVEIEEANRAAEICTLNALAAIKGVIGDLDRIKQIVRVVGYVSSVPTFTQQPVVVNGASELLLEIFGEAGKHARSAVGMAVLPLNASVEIELTVEVD
jgi:enamine deaminase RidA (YjgF/YER057c/UK114 family)